MYRLVSLLVLLCLVLAAFNVSAFAQTGNGQVNGVVQDASKALVPGVTITLTNSGTGITQTTITNEGGIYNFAVVPPGTYVVSASLPGFKTSVTNNVQVSIVPVRVNITLEIGQIDSKVEVAITADTILAETSPSVGTVLPMQRVQDLPIVGNNVLSLLDVLPGFRASPVADSASTIGGLNLDYTNTTIDGLSTVSSRDSASFWGRQVMTTNVINPDLVGEIRLILSPVDAELGRGNSQIQIQTRSGTNKYTGSAVWNVQNTALNSNTWTNKRNPVVTEPDWYNLNQITGSYGGPIIRNKTFFYALFDKQMVNRRQLISTTVLTDTARQGIWRYWEGWNPAQSLANDPTSFPNNGLQAAASVDFNGNPIPPNFNPTGGAYTLGGLRCFSIYGNMKVSDTGLVPVNPSTDCPGGNFVTNPGPWDTFRQTVDSTGYVQKVMKLMPHANYFATGGTDGLNTATFRWLQGRKGPSAGGATNAIIGVVSGVGDYNNRTQFNLKIDHNINSKHRISANWTTEKDSGDGSVASWGTGLNGTSSRRPQFLTVNGTSTLSPSLVNESRFGFNFSKEFGSAPWTNLDHPEIRDAAQEYIMFGGANPNNGKLYPVLYNPGGGWNGFMAIGSFDLANYSPLFNYADTVRWTKGKHSFSIGGEYRRPSTVGYNGSAYINASPGNAGGTATPQTFATTATAPAALPNFVTTTRGNAGTLLSTMYGAINVPTTNYWIDGQGDLLGGQWQDVTTVTNRFQSNDPYGHQTRTQVQNEWSFFAKDDYKLTRRLTVNLGVRFDFTGSPYLTKGLTNTIADDGFGLFGASRKAGVDPFSTWLQPGNLFLSGYGTSAANPLACTNGTANPNGIPSSSCDPNLLTGVIFVGPETNHPDKTLVPQKGAWSPALGFSYTLPWFGEGKTTVRGGFQRTYGKPGSPFTGGLLSGPGAGSSSGNDNSKLSPIFASGRAANLTDLALAVPSPPQRAKPEDLTYRIGSRSLNLTYGLYDPEYRNPHTDNWTLTITRSLSRSMTLEIRTINTLARDQSGGSGSFGSAGSYDVNLVNVYHHPELFQALELTRAGGNSVLLDQMLMGLNFNNTVSGYGTIGTCVAQPGTSTDPRLGVGCPSGQILQRASAHLRRSPTFAGALANGNYDTIASALLGNNNTIGIQTLPTDPTTGSPLVTSMRLVRNGCDRLANNALLSTGQAGFVDPASGQTVLPKCFPENYLIANSQVNGAQYVDNIGYSNYRSIEASWTVRPTHGLSFTATWGLSKTMVQPGSGFTDPLNPTMDFGKSMQSVGQDFRTNGTFELPMGPNKLLFSNSSGVLARMLERWQMGFIYNISSGSPRTFQAANGGLYANPRPNIVGPWTNPKGQVRWNGQNGSFLTDDYATYRDPQCTDTSIVTNLDGLNGNTICTMNALAIVVPQNTPGAILVNAANNTYGIPVLVNPKPGQQGNLGASTMNTFPRWRLDGNLSKTFQITESKSLQFRMDATNILNHPTPNDPTGYANGGNSFSDSIGLITGKGNQTRTFQARLRLSF